MPATKPVFNKDLIELNLVFCVKAVVKICCSLGGEEKADFYDLVLGVEIHDVFILLGN